MPINLKKNILFIHIPKCSGVYITNLFNMCANNLLHSTNNKNMVAHDCHIYGRTLQHYTINMIVDVINTHNIMKEKSIQKININNLRIFTIIRNPYDRFISAYNQYPDRCNLKFKEMINKKSIIDFAIYLCNKINKEGYDFFKYGAFHQFQPMIFYVKNDYGLDIEIIKMDEPNYNNIINKKCSDLGIKYNNIIKNKNNKDIDYSSYLNNKKFIECINKIYKDDFIFFNYATK